MQWSNENNKRGQLSKKKSVNRDLCTVGFDRSQSREVIGQSESRTKVYRKSDFAFKSDDTINVCLPKSK